MAKATSELIGAIRRTVENLKTGTRYEWGHMGSCNCGNLAQELTSFSRKEIHEYAMRKYGDWTEQAFDYCGNSGITLDFVISTMLDSGLELKDIQHLEKVSDPHVLKKLPPEERNLKHNKRDDVIKYMTAWADLLEETFLRKTKTPEIIKETEQSPTLV